MSDSAQRCNLLFAGELMPDTSQNRAQQALADFFGVDDAQAMARFFDGRVIPLRRNLSQAEATRMYRDLRSEGLLCRIESLPPPQPPPTAAPAPAAQAELALDPDPPAAPKQEPVPESAPGSEPEPRPSTAPKPAPKRKPAPKPRPAPVSEPKSDSKTELPPKPQPKPKPKPKPAPNAASKPEAKPKPRSAPAPAAGAKPALRPDAKLRSASQPGRAGTGTQTPAARNHQTRAPAAAPARAIQRPAAPARPPGGGPAPNFFALRPATPGPEAQTLRTRYGNRALLAAGVALTVAVLTAALLLRFPAAPARPMPALLDAAAAGDGRLLLLTEQALLLHGRSGRGLRRIPAQDLGLSSLAPPMASAGSGRIILGGTAPGEEVAALWRCELRDPRCERLTTAPLAAPVRALATNAQGSALFAHLDSGELLRLENGEPVARTAMALPPGRGRLLYDDGLLRVAAAEGPLLGVFRPDRRDFGKQLDALLLLPAPAMAAAVATIVDLARLQANYWLLLESEDGERGLFVFDEQWAPRGQVTLPADFAPRQLLAWRDKLLVAGADPASLRRFSSEGQAEAPLQLTLLAEQQAQWREAQRSSGRWRRYATSAAGVLLVAALLFAALNHLLARSFPDMPRTHSALLDPMPAGIFWLPAASEAPARLRRLGMLLIALAVPAPLLLVYLGAGAWALAGLPAWVGSLRAIQLLQRGRGGHCGLLPDRLIAVDYDGRYCFAPRNAARGTGKLLFLGAVALPIAWSWLPNLVADGALSRELQSNGAMSPTQQLSRLFALDHPWAHALSWLGAGWGLTAAVIVAFLLAG